MANGQTLTDDELAKKYGPGSHAAAAGGSGLSEDDLTKKYGATGAEPTPEGTAVEKADTIPKNYGFTVTNIGSNLKRLGAGALTMGKDVLFPEGKTEGERLKFLGKKYLFDPAEHERELARRGDQSALESIGHSTAAAIPFIGPFVGGLAEQAGTGDVGGAAAQGAGAYFGGKALGKTAKAVTDVGIKTLPKIGEVAGKVAGTGSLAPVGEAIGEGYQGVKDVIGEKTRLPDQSLKPKTAALARLAGSYALSHLGGGGEALMAELLGGGYLGPDVAKLILPKHPGIRTTPFEPATPEAAKLPNIAPLKRGPEEVYQRPLEPAPMAGKKAAPAEMHPAELEAIRKEAGNPEMTVEEAHRFRVNRVAGKAASTETVNDLGGMKRAGEEVQKIEPSPKRLPTLFEKGTRPAVTKMSDLIDQASGVKPLQPDVPLREQLTPQSTIPGEVVDPIKAKYPDPAVRQMVRANGERIYEAAKGKPETVKAIHDLTRVDLRQALVNAGEDMGQQTVSNSKFAGEGSITREEAFNRLLDKGLKPEEILKLAKPKPEGGESFLPEQMPRKPRTSPLPAQRSARERAARIREVRP